MTPRSASSIVQQMNDEEKQTLLATLDEKLARSLRELAAYPEDTAGAIVCRVRILVDLRDDGERGHDPC